MKRPIATIVLLAGLVVVADVACAQNRKQILAQPVAVTRGGMTGAFEIVESPSGIDSVGTGGACLLFSRHARGGTPCRTDSECTLDPPFAGGHAYCLHRDGAPKKKGRCWVRPAGNYCLRSPAAPHPLATSIAFPLDAAGKLQPITDPLPGWWRVHACLNGKVQAACGTNDPDRMISDGPPRRLP